jgi:hypothetical protein
VGRRDLQLRRDAGAYRSELGKRPCGLKCVRSVKLGPKCACAVFPSVGTWIARLCCFWFVYVGMLLVGWLVPLMTFYRQSLADKVVGLYVFHDTGDGPQECPGGHATMATLVSRPRNGALRARANDPAYSAEVGWEHGLGYWFAVYRGTDSDTLAECGLQCELPSLYDLIAASACTSGGTSRCLSHSRMRPGMIS